MACAVLLCASQAQAYNCSGKDGEYCCGSSVCICDNGEWVFQDECLYGCEGAGPNANCKPKPFCVGKGNGKYCDGNKLVTCSGGSTTSEQNCQYGCGGSGPNAYCKSGFCAGKADGEWCKGDEIYICDNDELVFIDGCLYGCNNGDGPNADCSPPPFCSGKANGKWCDGNKLITCSGGSTSNQQSCANGCGGGGPSAYCKSGFCAGKADGEWCKGDEIYICDNDELMFIDGCLYGCNNGDGPDADCSPPPDFCSGKSNGKWCKGGSLITCSNGQTNSQEACADGCTGNGPNAYCTVTGYCADKVDGEWCHGNEIYICDGGETVFIDGCLYGCEEGVGPAADCSPQSGWCGDKSDGQWCHNNDIYVCSGGEDTFIDDCLNGCNEGEGPNAQCNTPPGFCNGKADGSWCDGPTLKTCAGGVTVNSTDCKVVCEGLGPNAACAGDSFCEGKLDGYWCNDATGDLVLCQGDLISGTEECPDTGCIHKDVGEDDVCAEEEVIVPPEFCEGKPDSFLCDGGNLVQCLAGAALSIAPCPHGCLVNWPQADDECAELEIDPQFCIDKTGYYCAGESALVFCSGNVVAAFEECLTGCSAQEPGTPDLCNHEDPDQFCSHHGDGAWCNGLEELVVCAGGVSTSANPCPEDCQKANPGFPDNCWQPPQCEIAYSGSPVSVVLDENCCASFAGTKSLNVPIRDQTQYDDQLGTCEGETIKTWGCLITSLAMYYEFVDVNRTLDGEDLENYPDDENDWRTEDNQGYACCEDDCSDGNGICCAMWGTNPSGFGGFSHIGNSPEEGCLLSVSAANSIAAELNSGSPLVAWVTSGYTSQHWVLIVGVAADGNLLLNDPWKGQKGMKFNASSGLGPYTSIQMVKARGGIGGGTESPEPDETEHDGPVGVTQWTEEGKEEFGGFLIPAEPEEKSSGGCGIATEPHSAALLLLLLFVLLVVPARRRR